MKTWKMLSIGLISLMIFIVTIGTFFIIYESLAPSYDETTYNTEINHFFENEEKALIVFELPDSTEPQVLINEFKNGVTLWTENKEILNRILTIKYLTKEHVEYINKLIRYCDLRLEYSQTILKVFQEESNKYDNKIANLSTEISSLIEELNY